MKREIAKSSWRTENGTSMTSGQMDSISERQAAESLHEIAECQLSRRDQIAVSALQGLIARGGNLSYASGGCVGGAGSGGYGGTHESGTSADAIAEKAYQYADAMIKAAKK